MAAGRPLEYDSERHVLEAMKYIASCEDKTENGQLVQVKVPTIEGLALYLRISRDTVYTWSKQYSEFSDIIEQLKLTQADRLINNGLSGSYNSTIAKVILTKHGYTDKQEIEQKTEHSGTIQFGGIQIVKPDDPDQKV